MQPKAMATKNNKEDQIDGGSKSLHAFWMRETDPPGKTLIL